MHLIFISVALMWRADQHNRRILNLFPCSRALCEQLADFKALSAGALILQGVFGDTLSAFRPTPTDEFRAGVAQLQHLLADSNNLGE